MKEKSAPSPHETYLIANCTTLTYIKPTLKNPNYSYKIAYNLCPIVDHILKKKYITYYLNW